MRLASLRPGRSPLLFACSVLAACGPSRSTLNASPIDPQFLAATSDAVFVAAGKRRVVRFDATTGGTPAEVATFDADLAGLAVDGVRLIAWTSDGHLFDVPLDGTARKDHGALVAIFGAGTVGGSLLALTQSANDAGGPIAGLLEIPRDDSDEAERSSPHREPTDFTVAGENACWLDLGKRKTDVLGNITGRESARVHCWSKADGVRRLEETDGAFTAFHTDGTALAWSDGAKVFRRDFAQTEDVVLDAAPPAEGARVVQLLVEATGTLVRFERADGSSDLVKTDAERTTGILSNEVVTGDVVRKGGVLVVPFADRVEELAVE